MIGTDSISRVIGKHVYDSAGDKIGSASEVYLDDDTGQPEWVTVNTGLFGGKHSFVPIRDADLTDDGVRVPVTKDRVKHAPKIETDGHLSPEEEQELYRYYGVDSAPLGHPSAGTQTSDSAATPATGADRPDTGKDLEELPGGGMTGTGPGRADKNTTGLAGAAGTAGVGAAGMGAAGVDKAGAPDTSAAAKAGSAERTGTSDTDRRPGAVGHDVSGPTTDVAMTRSEEHLKIGTTREETGRARLRKFVVTEKVTRTVPVSHEEIRIEREPITEANVGDAMDGPTLSDEEHEVTLHAERVVIEKETVPVERVRLDTVSVTEDEQVSAELRKEEIEIDDPGVERPERS